MDEKPQILSDMASLTFTFTSSIIELKEGDFYPRQFNVIKEKDYLRIEGTSVHIDIYGTGDLNDLAEMLQRKLSEFIKNKMQIDKEFNALAKIKSIC